MSKYVIYVKSTNWWAFSHRLIDRHRLDSIEDRFCSLVLAAWTIDLFGCKRLCAEREQSADMGSHIMHKSNWVQEYMISAWDIECRFFGYMWAMSETTAIAMSETTAIWDDTSQYPGRKRHSNDFDGLTSRNHGHIWDDSSQFSGTKSHSNDFYWLTSK